MTSCSCILLYILSKRNAILFKCFLSYFNFSVLYNCIIKNGQIIRKKILVKYNVRFTIGIEISVFFLNFYNSDIFCDEDGTREFNKAYVFPPCKYKILIAQDVSS